MNIDFQRLKEEDATIIKKLLKQSESSSDDLTRIWNIMDQVWDEIGCDNKNLDTKKLNRFYSHPVWILNGLFIEQDQLSMQQRNAISNWIISEFSTNNVLDYGGGFGSLAKLICDKDEFASVDIYEPHPVDYAVQQAANYSNIRFIDVITKKYDVLVSTDVLEHVSEPLRTFTEMIASVKNNGYLIIANCFSPVMKCHLPQTFHLKYTFILFARYLGLEVMGALKGSHATIFKKKQNVSVNWRVIRSLEKLSKALYFLIEFFKPVLKPIYRLVKS